MGYFCHAEMGTLLELARHRLVQWMAANPKITQTAIGRAVGHSQVWVSRFKLGAQDADIDELDAMARVFGHTLNELIDARPNPKEQDLIDAYRAIEASKRPLAIEVVRAMTGVLPAPARKRTG